MPPSKKASTFHCVRANKSNDAKRGSSPIEVTDEAYKPAKKARTAAKPKASKDIGNCSMNKKEIGDQVKRSLALEKYHIPPMMFEMDIDIAFFRSFFLDNGALLKPPRITPSDFDEQSPIVVLELNNSEAGELLGVSKVRGGNRMATITLRSMCVVFKPKEEKATVWLTV